MARAGGAARLRRRREPCKRVARSRNSTRRPQRGSRSATMELAVCATPLTPVAAARAAVTLRRMKAKRKTTRRKKLASQPKAKITREAPILRAQEAAARLEASTSRPLPAVPQQRPTTGAKMLSQTFPPPTKGPVADVQRERLKAKERVAKHRKKLENERRAKELDEEKRRRQYAHVDLEGLREEAARRAKDAAAKNALAAAKIAAALKAKKEAAAAKRAADARARERRRAEIYALNHIMRDYFRGLGAVD